MFDQYGKKSIVVSGINLDIYFVLKKYSISQDYLAIRSVMIPYGFMGKLASVMMLVISSD